MFYWDPQKLQTPNGWGNGRWDTTSPIWYDFYGCAADVTWVNGADAVLGGGGVGIVTVSDAGITAASPSFPAAGYTLTGGTP